MRNIHTDLAIEAHEYCTTQGVDLGEGVEVKNESHGPVTYTSVTITSEKGQQTLGKPQGTYITIESAGLSSGDESTWTSIREIIAQQLQHLLTNHHITEKEEVLVVGLGNWDITPDALGPRVISKLFVTRHLFEHAPHVADSGLRPVSAISPGVLGSTGIETGEIIKGLSETIGPKLIIAIDALASRSLERLGTTIQISDTGIHPGSGIGNHRRSLTKETLGVPVIAIGVPTVVDAATIADDVLDLTIENLKQQSKEQSKPFYDMLQELGDEERYDLMHQSLGGPIANMIVTPKEIDDLIDDISSVIAQGIDQGLHPAVAF